MVAQLLLTISNLGLRSHGLHGHSVSMSIVNIIMDVHEKCFFLRTDSHIQRQTVLLKNIVCIGTQFTLCSYHLFSHKSRVLISLTKNRCKIAKI